MSYIYKLSRLRFTI